MGVISTQKLSTFYVVLWSQNERLRNDEFEYSDMETRLRYTMISQSKCN